jgi:predicted molibdopterin-dependent oxidoreductase YjgC
MEFEYRIEDHPILDFKGGKRVKFTLDGKELWGYEGEPIAAALHASAVKLLRRSVRLHRARGFFCAVGKCSSCLMRVDGVPNVMVCTKPLRDGMRVETQ